MDACVQALIPAPPWVSLGPSLPLSGPHFLGLETGWKSLPGSQSLILVTYRSESDMLCALTRASPDAQPH